MHCHRLKSDTNGFVADFVAIMSTWFVSATFSSVKVGVMEFGLIGYRQAYSHVTVIISLAIMFCSNTGVAVDAKTQDSQNRSSS